MNKLVAVEYWPNTNTWRILVAGVAVGYWPTEDEATLRARQARRELRATLATELAAVRAVVEAVRSGDRGNIGDALYVYDRVAKEASDG